MRLMFDLKYKVCQEEEKGRLFQHYREENQEKTKRVLICI